MELAKALQRKDSPPSSNLQTAQCFGINVGNASPPRAIATFFADGRGGFAGLCGFCSWLPLADQAASDILKGSFEQQLAAMQRLYLGDSDKQQELLSPPQLASTPILLEHCRDDEVIFIQNGTRMRDFLGQLGLSIEWREYERQGHWINEPQGVDDFVHFLQTDIQRATT